MTNITVTITAKIERQDGTFFEVTSSLPESVGDNPRFLARETEQVQSVVSAKILSQVEEWSKDAAV